MTEQITEDRSLAIYLAEITRLNAEIERLRAALTEAIDLIDFISLGNAERLSIRDGVLAKLRDALNPKE